MLCMQKKKESYLQVSGVSDSVLIAQALAGDQSAFECLFNRYNCLLVNYIRNILKDEDQTYDVLQQVFIKLYNSLSTLSTQMPLKPWLFRVAHNSCIDELRKRRRRTEVLFSTLEREDSEEPSLIEILLDSSPLPEEVAERTDLCCSLQQAILSLPAKSRSVVYLRCFGQLTFPEIGCKLNLPENTAKIHLYRSLPLLRRALLSNKAVDVFYYAKTKKVS